jgi:LmeA-like phospholipid-binding
VLLVLLVVVQLVLPGIAEQQLRDRLSHSGEVEHVEIHAFPAIELLWNHADRVVVRMRRYRSGTGHLASLLSDAGGVDTVHASAGTLTAGLLTVHDAVLHKHGNQVSATARVTESDLRSALPVLQSVVPVASGGGELTLRGTASLFGVTASVDATVRAQNGAIVVTPDVPFGGFATITVFSNPAVKVTGVSATPAPGGFYVSAQGQIK